MSMFAPQSASGVPVAPKIGLHSFKAGRLNRVEGTNRVKPDSRKGLIYLQEVDELLHFYWKDRNTGAVEDDLIIFPDEAEFVKVEESPSGRVYALKFSSSSQILFYWMQEKESTNDTADVERVNALIADPRAPAPRPAPSRSTPTAAGLRRVLGQASRGEIDLTSAARSMDLSEVELIEILAADEMSEIVGPDAGAMLAQAAAESAAGRDGGSHDVMDSTGSGATSEQLPIDLLGSSGPAPPSGEVVGSASSRDAISHINDDTSASSAQAGGNQRSLQDILAGIQVPSGNQTEREPLDLADVLTPEEVLPLLSDSSLRQKLFPHLPSSLVSQNPTESEVREVMTSPQWRQSLSKLSYALDQGGPAVVRALGFDPSQFERMSGVEMFIRAIARSLGEQHDEDDDRMEE